MTVMHANRRQVLNSVLTTAVGAAVGTTALRLGLAPASAATPIARTALPGGLTLIQGAGGNIISLGDAGSTLLVDSGARGLDVRAVLGDVPLSAVDYLFNTHWHLDHTGGNEPLARAGATIIGHENTRLWMQQEIIVEWQDRTYPPRPKAARPTRTFHYKPQTLTFGGQEIQYGYLEQAHTDGDIYVFFPEANVLVAGDVVSHRYPVLDYSTGGWIGGMVNGLKTLIGIADADTVVVPGTGSVLTAEDMKAQLEMCEAVKEMIAETFRQAKDLEDLFATNPTREFDKRWGDPSQFLAQAHAGAWGHVRELGGIF